MALAAAEPDDAGVAAARASLIGLSRTELADVVHELGAPQRTASMHGS